MKENEIINSSKMQLIYTNPNDEFILAIKLDYVELFLKIVKIDFKIETSKLFF